MSACFRSIVSLAAVLGVPLVAVACLWDYDTLRQERARFPTALELITGKFPRHSKEFYEWRIKDRLQKLAADPSNVAYHDDLAVAYEKTGRHDKAIETMLAKEKIKPGLYETYSNLGTFHILAGDFEKGLPYIDQALAINPDAHFGREKYQKWLVEYAISRRKDGKLLFPLGAEVKSIMDDYQKPSGNFQSYLLKQRKKDTLTDSDAQQAVKGVLGMMRFANHDSPLLLEALGDLLYRDLGDNDDAKQLSARAFLKASYVVEDPAAKKAYRQRAEVALATQTTGERGNTDQLELTDLESAFAVELADADKWYAELKENELRWIREGKDADAEFDRSYSRAPGVAGESAITGLSASLHSAIAGGAGVLVACGLAVIWMRLRNHRQTPREHTTERAENTQ